MDYESLRARVVSYFQRGNSWSLNGLYGAPSKGNPPDLCDIDERGRGTLRTEVALQVNTIVHEMLRSGILAPGLHWFDVNGTSSQREESHRFPLQVTEYGRQVLEGDASAVPDPEGFMLGLRRNARGLTTLELSYIEESVRAFHLYLYKASLVMLGGASEALMGRVIEGTCGKLPDAAKIRRELAAGILPGFRAWRESLRQNKAHLPPRAAELLQSVDHVFEIIRLCRNEAAHPKAIDVDRLEVQTLLLAFRRYAGALLQLKRTFR